MIVNIFFPFYRRITIKLKVFLISCQNLLVKKVIEFFRRPSQVFYLKVRKYKSIAFFKQDMCFITRDNWAGLCIGSHVKKDKHVFKRQIT